MPACLTLRRTPGPEGELVVVRPPGLPRGRPSPFDVPFRAEDYARVRAVVLETAAAQCVRYLPSGREVLRVQRLLDDEVSLHWLHRPESWASAPADEVADHLPARVDLLELEPIPEYAEMSARFGPAALEEPLACPCCALGAHEEGLGRPRRRGLALTPQEVWRHVGGPLSATDLAPWAKAIELYRCEACGATWAAAQRLDALRLCYESRRLTPEAFAHLLARAEDAMLRGDDASPAG